MKKIIFAFVAFAALSMTSCGNKTQEVLPQNDSDSVVVDSVSDSVSVDTVSADSAKVDSMSAE